MTYDEPSLMSTMSRIERLEAEIARLQARARQRDGDEWLDASRGLEKFSVTSQELAPMPALTVSRPSQSIPNAAFTPIQFTVKSYANVLDTTLPVSSIAVPLTGMYAISAVAFWTFANTGFVRVLEASAGPATPLRSEVPAICIRHSGTAVVRLLAGQAVSLAAYQDSGGALGLSQPTLTIAMIGN